MGDRNPKQQEKLAKQKRRAVAVNNDVSSTKRAVASPNADPVLDRHLRFRFDKVDLGSDWCLTYIDPTDHADLIAFLAEMETKSLKEAIPANCKREDVAGESRNAQAQRRARERYPDEHDYIHVLRLSGAKRLWSLLFENEFSIIWWDPTHAVFPTKRVYDN